MKPERPSSPFDFRTNLILYILLGLGLGLTIHFILLSTPEYNWFAREAAAAYGNTLLNWIA